MNIIQTSNKLKHTSAESNKQLFYSQILLDIILCIKTNDDDKHEFIALCEKEFKNDREQLSIVHEFKNNYTSNNALWWYTRETFLYQLLTNALRVNNILLVYLMRSFILDIKIQLKLNQCTTSIRVYRGQVMSNDEINVLQSSCKQFLSINSFLTASVNIEEALSFFDYPTISSDLKHVLLIIDANPNIKGIRPFANIAPCSYYTDEQEIIFMIGSIFLINEVKYIDEDDIWRVHMILTSDDDHQIKPILDDLKNEYGQGEMDLLTLGRALRKIGKYNDAEQFYLRFLNQHQNDDRLKAQCFHLLGNISFDIGNYDASLDYHFKSLEIKMKLFDLNNSSLAYSYNSIGIVQWKKGDTQQALQSYENALKIWTANYGNDDLKVAMCLNNMGIVYDDEKKFHDALKCYEKALNIRLKKLPHEHHDIGDTYNNIGAVYRCLGQYDTAIDYFNRSLSIYEMSLFTNHPSFASTCKNIGVAYEMKNNFQLAKEFYTKAATIFHQQLQITHPDVIEIDQLIRQVSFHTNSKN